MCRLLGLQIKAVSGLFRQSFFQTRKGPDRVLVLYVTIAVGSHYRSDNVHLAPNAMSQDLDAVAEQCAQIAGVTLANSTQTNHQNLHSTGLFTASI